MSEALIIFKAINGESDRQTILQKVLANQETIYLRDKSDLAVELKAMSINSNFKIKCLPLAKTTFDNFDSGRITANVSIDGQSYIFDTELEVAENFINLPVFNLFHLQQRKNFRYVLPEDYRARFVITLLNQTVNSLDCRLLDLSTDGCAVEISLENANLKVNDKIEGTIALGDREPILTQGFIKNIRPKGDTHLVLGLEFNFLTHASEHKIVNSLTDLQRELYFRRAN